MNREFGELEVRNLSRVFQNVKDGISGGVRDSSFVLESGTFFTLLGPSGCGKTTTLRCIAGLETPDEGLIRLGETVFADRATGTHVPMNRRNIGMVFQSYAIWPHMSVFDNVAFPLRVAKDRSYSRDEMVRMVGEALESVDLGGFQSRSATMLSGGQQQRVALARAVVRRPKLLLLDEPLSNLDAALRESMRRELKRLQRQIGVTTVYVTHDQAEALDMSDLVAVMNQGRIVQLGTPRDIYFRPARSFVARFVGSTNLLTGTVVERQDAGTGTVRLADGIELRSLLPHDAAIGRPIGLSVRPESIEVVDPTKAPGADNFLAGRVVATSFLGNMNRLDVDCGGFSLQVNTRAQFDIQPGVAIGLSFPVDETLVTALD